MNNHQWKQLKQKITPINKKLQLYKDYPSHKIQLVYTNYHQITAITQSKDLLLFEGLVHNAHNIPNNTSTFSISYNKKYANYPDVVKFLNSLIWIKEYN